VTTPLDVLNTPPGDDEQPGVNPSAYDAVVLVSFGGPEGPDDVLPFMQNVTRGRGIPAERLVQVSQHYNLFGGVSPINGQNRQLIAALETEFALHGIELPIYWGNRNWTPYLADTMAQMKADGVGRALAFVTSAYSSYSGCRQYREDIIAARETLGDGAPVVDKIRVFYNHPGFIEPMVDGVLAALAELPEDVRNSTHLAFTAHSIPMANADSSDYVAQLRDASQLVAEAVFSKIGVGLPWALVFQSRSGAPGQPWLEPDICDHLEMLHDFGAAGVLMVPIGFISDHMEVVYDLDTQAREKAAELGLPLARSATVGTDPRFVRMIRLLVQERIALAAGLEPDRLCVGERGANHDVCPMDCCPAPARPTSGPGAAGAAGVAPGGRPSASSGDGVLGRPVSEGGAGSAPGRPLSDRTSTPPALRPENGGATS
jgi:protoporphyrin/coproporphyrin ferrochelatase